MPPAASSRLDRKTWQLTGTLAARPPSLRLAGPTAVAYLSRFCNKMDASDQEMHFSMITSSELQGDKGLLSSWVESCV